MRRSLALLATCGLLGITGVVASSATPALADSFFVSLKAAATTLAVGGTTTLTATTGTDVGPTPWFIDIFDSTTGTRLNACASGTTCSITVSQSTATTHTYVAYVASGSFAFPPANIQGTSNTSFVTWTSSNLRIKLNGSSVVVVANGPGTYIATSNVDVGPTPYTIEIYDEMTASLLVFCTTGTTCTAKLTPSTDGDYVVAFTATFIQIASQSYPPPLSSIQASSNVILTRGFVG